MTAAVDKHSVTAGFFVGHLIPFYCNVVELTVVLVDRFWNDSNEQRETFLWTRLLSESVPREYLSQLHCATTT